MRAMFSEFQFAYGITNEIDGTIWGPNGPYIPNQREEAAGGYDCSFDNGFRPLFIQFKLTERLTTNRAHEWEFFEREYYRFKIYPDSRSPQHNLLINLAHRNRRNLVVYCAPQFINFDEWRQYHLNGTVLAHSVLIDCYDLPPINGVEEHCICYDDNSVWGYMFSEPKGIKISNAKEKLEYELKKTGQVYKNIETFIEDMKKLLKEINYELESSDIEFGDIYEYLMYLNLNLILVRI